MYENCTEIFKIIKSVKEYLNRKTFIPVILVYISTKMVKGYENVKDYFILILNVKRCLKEGITGMKVWV